MEDKIEFIDDFLMRCEDWMHGEDGKDVTLCRKYLSELQEQVKNCSIPDVVGQSEQLKAFREWTREHLDEKDIVTQQAVDGK